MGEFRVLYHDGTEGFPKDLADADTTVLGGIRMLGAQQWDFFEVEAEESVTKGDPVYLTANNKVGKARADTDAKCYFILGIATDTKTEGEQVKVVMHGPLPGAVTGASAGTRYFLDNTGGIVAGMPTGNARKIRIGIAYNATDLWVLPSDFGRGAGASGTGGSPTDEPNKISTSSATPANLFAKTLNEDSAVVYRVRVVAKSDDNTVRGYWVIEAGAYRELGEDAVLEYMQMTTEYRTSQDLGVEFTVAGGALRVQVTGLAATTIYWSGILEITYPAEA